MQELICTVGASSSGKTMFAEEYIKKHKNNAVNLNRDDFRRAIHHFDSWKDYKFNSRNENIVTEAIKQAAAYAAGRGQNVIISDTNLNPKIRAFWQDFASEHKMNFRLQVFDVPLHILERRNALRNQGVSPEILLDQWKRFNDQFGVKYNPNQHAHKPEAVIFDVDGTLAQMVDRSPYEWDRVGEDLPVKQVVEYAKLLRKAGHNIIILTGRDGVCEEATKAWLARHGVVYDDFYIREAGNQEADYLVKLNLFREASEKWCISHAVDDRDQVVNLWRGMGIPCFQVNYGKF